MDSIWSASRIECLAILRTLPKETIHKPLGFLQPGIDRFLSKREFKRLEVLCALIAAKACDGFLSMTLQSW